MIIVVHLIDGISACLFSNTSPDCEDSIRENDDQYEAKILVEKDGNPKLSQDISDELDINSNVTIQKIVSIDHNLCRELDQLPRSEELESTCKKAEGMGRTTPNQYDTDTVAEHESYVVGAVCGLSSSEMPSCLGYYENGDTNSEAGVLSDNGGDDSCEKISKVESIKLFDTSTTISKTDDEYEASDEKLTMTVCQDENVIPLGQSCLSGEGTDHGSESAEENTISLSGSPNDLDKLKGCQDILVDAAMSESLSYTSIDIHKSEQEMAQSSEASFELSDADFQRSDVSKKSSLTAYFEDDNIFEEASVETSSGPVSELANIASFNGQSIDKGTSLHHSSKVSSVYTELTQRGDTDYLNGAMIFNDIDAKGNSLKDVSDESHVNNEVEILKTLQDSDKQCEVPCSAKVDCSFLEAKEAAKTTQDPNTIVAPAEHGSVMHLHLEEDNNADNDKNSENSEENSNAQMVELCFEGNGEDFKNDTHTISNLPASAYNDMLKESDVADTIKEYIDSESSLSMIFENSTTSNTSARTDEMIDCENSALSKHKDDISGRLTAIKEQEEATLFRGPSLVSIEGSSNKLRSNTKKNARTILIQGTPNKLLAMADMKENVLMQKSSNIGDITAVRPAKRRALQDAQWK